MLSAQRKMGVLLVIVLGVLVSWCSALSDKRLCADPLCQKIISLGTTQIKYSAPTVGMVSFNRNSKVRVLSKSAGSDLSLWGIEVNGRKGYAPKNFILESKVLVKDSDLQYEVPVELPDAKPSDPAQPKVSENLPRDTETKATAPLDRPTESNELPIVTASTVVDNDSVRNEISSTAPQKVEFIDGTQIPIMEDAKHPEPMERTKTESSEQNRDVDEDIEGDYTDDYPMLNEEEPEQKIETKIEDQKIEEKVKNLESNETASADVTEEHIMMEKEDVISAEAPKSIDPVEVNDTSTEQAVKFPETPVPIETVEAVLDNLAPNSSEVPILLTKETSNVAEGKVEEVPAESEKAVNVPEKLTLAEATAFEEVKNVPDNEEKENSPNSDHTVPVETVKEELREVLEDIKNDVVTPKVEQNDQVEIVDRRTPNAVNISKLEDDDDDDDDELVEEEELVDEEDLLDSHSPVGIMDMDEFEIGDTNDLFKILKEDPTSESTIKETVADITANKPNDILHTTAGPVNANEEIQTPPILNPVTTETQVEKKENPKIETATESSSVTEPGYPHDPQGFDIGILETTTTSVPIVEQNKFEMDSLNPTEKPSEVVEVPQTPSDEVRNKYDGPPMMTTLPLFQPPASVPHQVPPHPQVHENENNYQQPPEQSDENISPTPQESTPTATGSDQHPQIVESVEENVRPAPELDPNEQSPEVGVGHVESLTSSQRPPDSQPVEQPSVTSPPEPKAKGLFATMLDTVNNMISSNGKKESESHIEDEELQRILYPDRSENNEKTADGAAGDQFCEKLSPGNCPSLDHSLYDRSTLDCHCGMSDITLENFVGILAAKTLEMSDLIACLVIAAAATLFFVFGYYCFCNSSREGALLAKLNLLERSLLASHKENAILKDDLMKYRTKLSSIEDNSFGSNDMVMSLKKELEEEMLEKRKLQEQVGNLEKELENAAEAGLELNKIVSELLSNQTGDESIISSVEELQKQLNEQQSVIMEINANLAEKSRENSELQIMIAEQDARLNGTIASLQQDNDELEAEKSNLQTRLEEVKAEFEEDISRALEGKNFEINRLQSEIMKLEKKWEDEHLKWQTGLAKIEALEECLKNVKKDPNMNIKDVIDVANVRAEVLDLQRKRASLQERLDSELESRKVAEKQLAASLADVERLKQDFHQSEKDKLEAQTRLEVLSNYFKEKETQLQKELSLKEAMWLKQQGEATSTVDRLTAMQDEIQSLRSRNDSLRAETEAQEAAHKAQIGTLENRAHEAWLAGRQWERRYEETRAEASALRRKLTTLVGTNPNELSVASVAGESKLSTDLNNAPSPIHMESPGPPLLGHLPPPFLPPFLPPPPFCMPPPPPFGPPGDMRPPPLGRIMSPPPSSGGASAGRQHHSHRSGRYSPPDQRRGSGDYDDDDDEDDDDYDDDDEIDHRRRRSVDHRDNWHRDRYSPQPRSYRSQSPADSRYNYTSDRDLMSMYDTETDISPPPSPRAHRSRGSRSGSFKAYSPPPQTSAAAATSPLHETASGSGKKRSSGTKKGIHSSGSDLSYGSIHRGKKKSTKPPPV